MVCLRSVILPSDIKERINIQAHLNYCRGFYVCTKEPVLIDLQPEANTISVKS
jgi:hypothetical protein